MVNLELLDTSKGSYYEFRKCTKKMKQSLAENPPGGFVLFSRNIETRDQVLKLIANLQDASKYPLFAVIFQEWLPDRFLHNEILRHALALFSFV